VSGSEAGEAERVRVRREGTAQCVRRWIGRCLILGHGKDGVLFVLAHQTLWGSSLDDDTWAEVDKLLRQHWKHPSGGTLKVDAAVIDAGDGGVYDVVMKFSASRLSRRVLAGKGAAGFGRSSLGLCEEV
jgi:phage terminase large subunit GpA-like protein